jgi:transglutaminase-like putative cysteine protease
MTRPLSAVVVIAWAVAMAALVNRSYVQASASLATDLARYGSDAHWRGVYYRGEKIGFTVSQTVPHGEGYELQEDGQLQMTLLGASTFARIRTTARVSKDFTLSSFDFSLDPGTGPINVSGTAEGRRLTVNVTGASGATTQTFDLDEPPMLSLTLSRRLASGRLTPGARHEVSVFDPATLRNAPAIVHIGKRELVRLGGSSLPAFRVEMEFSGLRTTSWITDTGEVVREESPMGLISVRETAQRATSMAVPGEVQTDLLQAAAVVPESGERIDDTRDVLRLRLRVTGADLTSPDLHGEGQSVAGDVIELRDARTLAASPTMEDLTRYLRPEPLIESDAPEIRAEATAALAKVTGARARAEALTRHVNALLEKKPTVSLPSAREVLRTRIGDCNEHTALYVAMARAAGIPSRIAVGLTFIHGAFYYHAWPEVYLGEGSGRGLWLPVDPTLNQFPADATHIRLARGGLDKQAQIIPMVGQIRIAVLDLDLAEGARRVLVGGAVPDRDPSPLAVPAPNLAGAPAFPGFSNRSSCDCWCLPRRRS